jgi:hypothetical protein
MAGGSMAPAGTGNKKLGEGGNGLR